MGHEHDRDREQNNLTLNLNATVHIHYHDTNPKTGEQLQLVNAKLDYVIQQGEKLMKLSEDLKALLKAVDDETNRLAALVQAQNDRILNSSLTDAEKQEIIGNGNNIVARLRGIGKDPENPVPVEPMPEPNPNPTA